MKRLGRSIEHLRRSAGAVSARTGRSALAVAVDMLWCMARYGASPGNYMTFGWADSECQRETYMTYRHNQRLMRNLNGSGEVRVLDDKGAFAIAFAPLLGREVLLLDEASEHDVRRFIADNGRVVWKRRKSAQGRRVVLMDASKSGLEEIAGYVMANRSGALLEERVVQHAQVSHSFGEGLAPIRVVSARARDGGVRLLFAAITFDSPAVRNGDRVGVVNYHTGGVMAPVDIETGRVSGPAVDKAGGAFEVHPSSGVAFDGFVLPCWRQVRVLALSAAGMCTVAGYVGWDIGLADAGPCLIEGNTDPGTYGMVQSVVRGRRAGIREAIRDLL